jgi:hypothetical protein
MSEHVSTSNKAPEGARAVTAKDVISKAEPVGVENIEYWLFVSPQGQKEVVRIRPDIGEKGEYHRSPLDGSVLGIRFVFKTGDQQNEVSGERYVPVSTGAVFFVDCGKVKENVYREGESPAELELKRRAAARAQSIQERAAKLNESLDEDDIEG